MVIKEHAMCCSRDIYTVDINNGFSESQLSREIPPEKGV